VLQQLISYLFLRLWEFFLY